MAGWFRKRSKPQYFTARGEAHAVMLTAQNLAGPGVAMLPKRPITGDWLFRLDSGAVHTIPRRAVRSVEPVEGQPGSLTIALKGWGLMISITPEPLEEELWRALSPK